MILKTEVSLRAQRGNLIGLEELRCHCEQSEIILYDSGVIASAARQSYMIKVSLR